MKKATVTSGQNIMDVAIEHCGDLEALFSIIKLNNLSLTESLALGRSIAIPEHVNSRMVAYYGDNNIHPATADIQDGESVMTDNHEQNQLITNNLEEKIVFNNE